MMARRGVELEMVHFRLPPYTSQQARDKVLELARLLTAYCGRMLVHIVPFTEIQGGDPPQLPGGVLHPHHAPLHDAHRRGRGEEGGAKALITGESLGQVASQTMMAPGVTEDVTTMPVLRPLIGMDKVEIIRIAREIGTFDTSILPYEDCCTVFTPRHPCHPPGPEAVRAAEAVLDMDGLVAKAMAGGDSGSGSRSPTRPKI